MVTRKDENEEAAKALKVYDVYTQIYTIIYTPLAEDAEAAVILLFTIVTRQRKKLSKTSG